MHLTQVVEPCGAAPSPAAGPLSASSRRTERPPRGPKDHPPSSCQIPNLFQLPGAARGRRADCTSRGIRRIILVVAMPDDLQTRIVGIIQRVSKQAVQVSPDESLFDSGLLDSFALPDMVSALEDEFGIKVPDSDLTPRKFESIASIGRYIESRT